MGEGRAHGIAPSRLDGRVIIVYREMERRRPRRFESRAAKHFALRVGARDVLQLGFEDRAGRQGDSLAIEGRALQGAGGGGRAGGGPCERRQKTRSKPSPMRSEHRFFPMTESRSYCHSFSMASMPPGAKSGRASGGVCETRQTLEQPAPIRPADQRFDEIFGMRHEAEDPEIFRIDARRYHWPSHSDWRPRQ